MTSPSLDANDVEDENASVTSLNSRILRCLRRNVGEPLSANEIAAALKVARGKVVPVLCELYDAKILDAKEIKGGRMTYWVRRPQDEICLLQAHWKGWNLK